MITLCRNKERPHIRRSKSDVWQTAFPQQDTASTAAGFHSLGLLVEAHLSPGAGLPRYPRREAEILSYVREGALAYEDSLGRSGVIQAGEVQLMIAGRTLRHSETNASRGFTTHVFQLWLHPKVVGLEPRLEQRRFSTAQRRGGLCDVASGDGRRGSLRLHQDTLVRSTMLEDGQHVVHELAPGRAVWLHLVEGEANLGDHVLLTGDGAGIADERAVSFTARGETEILLIDLACLSLDSHPVGFVI